VSFEPSSIPARDELNRWPRGARSSAAQIAQTPSPASRGAPGPSNVPGLSTALQPTSHGITPSGTLHIGNYFGAMRPAIRRADAGRLFLFHRGLSLDDDGDGRGERRKNTQGIALDWLACGLDPKTSVFWRQSDVPEVCELMWMLGTPRADGPHGTRAQLQGQDSEGPFAELRIVRLPVLMAADILLYDTHRVPVGRDQKQHVEMTRDMAIKFNEAYGETLVVPESEIRDEVR